MRINQSPFGNRKLRAALVAVACSVLLWASGPTAAQTPPATISGQVTGSSGPVAGVVIDLFSGNARGERVAYLRSVRTNGDGGFRVELADPGCSVLTFIAPGRQTWRVTGTTWLNQPYCLRAGEQVRGANAVLVDDTAAPARLGGQVTDTSGQLRSGVAIDLFLATADGGRGPWMDQTTTGDRGRFQFAPPGDTCYVLTFIAPDGDRWETSGTPWLNQPHCVDGDGQVTDADAVLHAPPGDDPGTPRPGNEQAILDLVNTARASAGCSALTLNRDLNDAALAHSADMATRNYFDHVSPEGEGPGDRIARTDYRPRTWGENIAYGYGDAQSVMDGWMNSDGHRRNILNCSFEDLGVGYATHSNSGNRPYWTQVFGAER